MPNSLYMLGEHFKNKGAAAVCRRFRDRGRMAPEGRTYLSSWVDEILRAVDGELERPRKFRSSRRCEIAGSGRKHRAPLVKPR
jgi:hypothetical protein